MKQNKQCNQYNIARPTFRRQLPLLLSFVLILLNLTASGQKQRDVREIYGPMADQFIEGAEYVLASQNSSYPMFVRLAPSSRISAAEFIPWLRRTVNEGREVEFKLVSQRHDKAGMEHFRYQQLYKGIPVEHSMYIAHAKDGLIKSFNGDAITLSNNLSSTPVLTESEALEMALKIIGASKYSWQDPAEEAMLKKHMNDEKATYFPKGELVFVNDATGDVRTGKIMLAWKFDIREVTSELNQRIFISAESGEKVNSYPITLHCDAGTAATTWHGSRAINTDKPGSNFILLDDCAAADIRTVLEAGTTDVTDADNSWTENAVRGYATTHFYAKETIDYYESVHSWSSYDDANGNVLLQHRSSYANAFYDVNGMMVFGDGNNTGSPDEFYNTRDVIGHEFTHGVVEESAGLVYQGESGGLNESFADIFGECVERRTENNTNIDWLHREDYYNGENRSFISPKDQGQPDTYLGTNWACTTGGCGDNGGVHTNSGVMNHWWYLVNVGGTGTNDNNDDYEVSGIGINKARDIAFLNLTAYLGPNSDYAAARAGAIQAAIDLFGTCSNEVKQVTNAWYAVGVGDPFINATASVTSDYNGRDVSCVGSCDGSVTVVGANGTGTYDYLWSANAGSAITQSVSNLCAGVYTVTITDDAGCTATASVTIENPPALSVTAAATSDYNGFNVSCNGGNDGTAEAFPSGGTPAYTYAWSDAQTTKVASGLSATTYSVTVTDANGCTANSGNILLTEPMPLTIDAGANQTVYYGYPDSSCASLTASGIAGGVPPYTLTWSTASNDASINVCPVSSTVYYVTVEDANGCTAIDSVMVCVIDVRCGNKLDKVRICHNNSGSSNPLSLCISLTDVPSHLADHADALALCSIDKSCNFTPAKHYSAILSSDQEGYLTAIPNPFTGKTSIRFSLPLNVRATVQVYDIMGREVAEIFNGQAIGGNLYSISFDGENYPAGVYIAVLRSENGEHYVNKMILRK